MKANLIFNTLVFNTIVMCLLQGCKQTTEEKPLPELTQAEAVMFEHPDSALHILDAMQKPDASNKEQHALWCLLVTQAQYKQSFTFHSDSLIRIAYDYYRPTNNARRKALSALYMGNVNYELKHITEAMNYFLEAKADMEKTTDYKLGYLVMSSLGNLYVYRDLTDYALEAFQEAYDYAVKDSCKRYEMTSLQYLGRAYAVKEEYERAIHSYIQAIQIRDSIHETFNLLESELADVYFALGEYEKALDLEKQAIKNDTTATQDYYGIGETFLCLEKYDSAYYYLKKALHTSNVYTLAGVYDALLSLSHQPTYRQYMADFCDSLQLYQDSVNALDQSKNIIACKEKYEYQKLINKNKKDTYQTIRLLLFIILAILCLTGIITYFYLRRKTTIRRKEEEVTQLNENKLLITQNNAEELDLLKSQKDKLSMLLLENHPYLTALHQTPVCLTDTERNHICQLTNTLYTDFCKRLLTQIPTLSEYEVLLCCLIKLHFSVSEIAILLAISPASVSTSKSRLKKKIYTHLKLSSEKKSFDTWIWEF